MAELVLDINIRGWVFLPIVLITFLVGVIRHYVSLLITSQKKVELTQVQDSQVLIRSRMLRENGRYISKQGFYMRRHYFNNEENGYFKTQKRAAPAQTAMPDPSMMTEMLKGNVTNVLPMVVIGGWINWMFSGFVTTKVPFPLTLRFKPMLQRGNLINDDFFYTCFNHFLFSGIELVSLDAAWVSSASWYFLNVFGLRSIYALVLGENNAADQSRLMQDQMSGAAMSMPIDPKVAFKAEWEALEISSHKWALADLDNEVLNVLMNKSIK